MLTKHAECTSYHSWLLYWFYSQGPRIAVTSINFWKEATFTWHEQIFWQSQWGSQRRQSATPVRHKEYWCTSNVYWRDWCPSWALSWLLVHSNGKLRKPRWRSAIAETLLCFQTYELPWRKLSLSEPKPVQLQRWQVRTDNLKLVESSPYKQVWRSHFP